jgi:hypothetical protein
MAAKKRKVERESASSVSPADQGDAPVTKQSVATSMNELKAADTARAAKLPGRKATEAELTRDLRASRRKKGVTKTGEKRKGVAPAKAYRSDIEEGLETTMAGERGETSATATRELSGRATGLSEDIGESGMSATELAQSGTYLGDYDTEPVDPASAVAGRMANEEKFWEELGRTPKGKASLEAALATIRDERGKPPSNKQTPTRPERAPEMGHKVGDKVEPYDHEARSKWIDARTAERRSQAARQAVSRSAPISRTTGLPTGQVLPPSVPLTKEDALARQQFWTGNTSSKLRTTQPGLVQVPVMGDDGTVRVTHIPRPNKATAEPLEKTLYGPARREAAEATKMLGISDLMKKVDDFAASHGPVESDESDPRSTTRKEIVTNAAGNLEGRVVTTRSMTRREAASKALAAGHITNEEYKLMHRRGAFIPGQPSSPRILSGIGDSEASDEFRKNVAAKVTEATTLPDVPVTEETPFKTMGGGSLRQEADPTAYKAYVERVAKTQREDQARNVAAEASGETKRSRRFTRIEKGPYPKTAPKKIGGSQPSGLRGTAPLGDFITEDMAESLEGSNATEKLRNALKDLSPVERARRVSDIRAVRIPEGSEVPLSKEEAGSEAVTQARAAQGLPSVNEQVESGTWPKVAAARRAISKKAGRDIGSQSADEAARITSAEDWTQRYIRKDLMGAPEGAGGASQAALHIRAADPRRRGMALDQTRFNRKGMAEPTDAQIVYMEEGLKRSAATKLANSHLGKVYEHLKTTNDQLTGYGAAAAKSFIASYPAAEAKFIESKTKGLHWWDRTPGGAGAVREGMMTEAERTSPRPSDNRDRARAWTGTYTAPSINANTLRPAEEEAIEVAGRRAALMATPEGRTEIAAGKAASEEALNVLRSKGLTSGYIAGQAASAADNPAPEVQSTGSMVNIKPRPIVSQTAKEARKVGSTEKGSLAQSGAGALGTVIGGKKTREFNPEWKSMLERNTLSQGQFNQ